MTRLYYPLAVLWRDHLRAGLGLAFCLALMLFNSPVSVIFFLLAGVSLLLAWLSAHTLWRQQIEFKLDIHGVERFSRWGWTSPRRVAWEEMQSVRLRYYSTRRDRSDGWMTVTITGHGGTLRADSDLQGFELLATKAVAEALRLNLSLDPATLSNARLLERGGLQ
jgi:hypothetical protein